MIGYAPFHGQVRLVHAALGQQVQPAQGTPPATLPLQPKPASPYEVPPFLTSPFFILGAASLIAGGGMQFSKNDKVTLAGVVLQILGLVSVTVAGVSVGGLTKDYSKPWG